MSDVAQQALKAQPPAQGAAWQVAGTAIALALLPFALPYPALATNVLIYGLYACAFNLLFGSLGLLSFGHAALLGAGAYGCGIALKSFAMPWPLAITAGMIAAALVALLTGALAVRVRGIAFSFVTLALAQCCYYLVQHAESWTGGESGLRGVRATATTLGGWTLDFANPLQKYYAPSSSLRHS